MSFWYASIVLLYAGQQVWSITSTYVQLKPELFIISMKWWGAEESERSAAK